jgi:hypothetical protein
VLSEIAEDVDGGVRVNMTGYNTCVEKQKVEVFGTNTKSEESFLDIDRQAQ